MINVPDYSSVEVLESFLQESVVMKNFDHPNVLHILGVGLDPDNGLPFIVLPFMANGNLQLYLKSKRSKLTNVDQLPEVTILVIYCVLCGRIKGYNSSITTIMCQGGSYRTVVLLTHFYQRNTFVYSLNVLNFKAISSVNTSLSVKYNKTFKALPLCLYES